MVVNVMRTLGSRSFHVSPGISVSLLLTTLGGVREVSLVELRSAPIKEKVGVNYVVRTALA